MYKIEFTRRKEKGETRTSRWSQKRERMRKRKHKVSLLRPLHLFLRLLVVLLLFSALTFVRVPSFPQAESNQYFRERCVGEGTHACGSRSTALREFNCEALSSRECAPQIGPRAPLIREGESFLKIRPFALSEEARGNITRNFSVKTRKGRPKKRK